MNDRSKPRCVSDIRLSLLREWGPGGTFTQAIEIIRSLAPKPQGHERTNDRFERDSLHSASLWWVSAEMADLWSIAAPSIPTDTTLSRELVPRESGLVVIESEVIGMDAESDERTMPLHALLWGPVNLRGEGPAIGISWYRFHAPGDYAEIDLRSGMGRSQAECDPSDRWAMGDRDGFNAGSKAPVLTSALWAPLGRSDWRYGDRIDTFAEGQFVTRHAERSAMEDRRFLASLWSLALTPGVCESTKLPLDRASRRRGERAGVAADGVTVVTLRTLTHDGEHGTGRSLSVRSLVSGHWRQQACGPGRKERRPTWIAPHLRGPEDAPLSTKTVVNAWRR